VFALAVLAAVVFVGTGLFVSRRVTKADDFFVAGRRLPGSLVFATLLAANIGAGSTVGATGLGYRYGLSAWWWSGSAALGCVVLGLVVVPRLQALAAARGFLTVGDYLEARYDRSVRGLVGSVLWLGTLAILAGQLIAMAWAFEVLFGLPKAVGCGLGGLIVVTYVAGGGLLASVWVNVLELGLKLVGFALAVPFAWRAAGGWDAMAASGPPSYGSIVGMGAGPIVSLLLLLGPSFVVSPGLIQKTYGARSTAAAQAGVLANALCLAAFAFLPALLGMATHALRPNLAHAELALPTLLRDLLPPWLGGLGLVALFAAELSAADAVLFMLSTSLSKDLYKGFVNPGADDALLLRVGRRASVVGGLLGVGLAVLIPSVVDALKTFYGILTAVLFVPLLAGLLSEKPTAGQARVAVVAAVATTVALPLFAPQAPAWLPGLTAIVLATAAVVVPFGRRD
jgi:SSS family solute:Na+ symporter